jgi:hypothetical protein
MAAAGSVCLFAGLGAGWVSVCLCLSVVVRSLSHTKPQERNNGGKSQWNFLILVTAIFSRLFYFSFHLGNIIPNRYEL